MKKVAIIQARMSSTRLPGKVLKDLAGRPMLERVLDRVRLARTLDAIVVATSVQPEDDAIGALCRALQVPCERGSRDDVLARYYDAAVAHGAEAVIRLTADCPLLDPEVIDLVVKRFLQGDCDYATNTIRRTEPDGLDVEVFSFAALERAHREAAKPSEREHVTPFIRHSGLFRIAGVERDHDWSRYRWTVDEASDLALVSEIYRGLGPRTDFSSDEVVRFLEAHPELVRGNAHLVSSEGYFRSLYQEARGSAAPFRPAFRSARAEGCRQWDADGREFLDFSDALLHRPLGHGGEGKASRAGSLGELDSRLRALFPGTDAVLLCRGGLEARTALWDAARQKNGVDFARVITPECGDFEAWARPGKDVLILDETNSPLRFHSVGVVELLGLGEGLGNGLPIGCVIGRREILEQSDYVTPPEARAVGAALGVLDVLERSDAIKRAESMDRTLRNGLNVLAREAGLARRFRCVAGPRQSVLVFVDDRNRDGKIERGLFEQECHRRGVLIGSAVHLSAAHDTSVISRALEAFAAVFKTMSGWLSGADPARHLAA